MRRHFGESGVDGDVLPKLTGDDEISIQHHLSRPLETLGTS